MKKNHTRRPAFFLAMAAILLLAMTQLSAGAKSPSGSERERNAAKARDLYVEAMQYMAMDDMDAGATLLRQAYALSPDDNDIRYQHGLMLAIASAYMGGTDAAKGVDMMRAAVEADPSNTHYGLQFLSVASNMPGVEFSPDDNLALLSRIYSAASDRSLVASTYAALLRSTNNADSIRKGIAILDSLEYAEGPSQEVTTAKVQAYINLGDTAAAIAVMKKLCNSHPTDPDYLMALASTYELLGFTDTASSLLDRGIELYPDLPNFYVRKAVSCSEKGDTLCVVNTISDAMAAPEMDYPIKEQILHYFLQTMFDDKYEWLETPVQTLAVNYPNEYNAIIGYANILVNAGDTIAALEQYEAARRLDPSSVQGYSLAAHVWSEAGNISRAAQLVKEGISRSGEPGLLRRYLVYLYTKHHRYSEALPYVSDYISEMRRDFDVESAIAQRDEIASDSSAQITELELVPPTAVFTDESDDIEYVEAIDSVDSAIVEEDDTLSQLGELYLQRADIYTKLNKVKAAIADYEMALRLLPDSWLPYNNFAYMLANRNIELDHALQLAEKSMSLVENSPDFEQNFISIGDTYAWVLFRRGQLLKAKELIDQVLESTADPEADVLDHAGDIYKALGLTDEALQFWSAAMAKDPDDKEAITTKINSISKR